MQKNRCAKQEEMYFEDVQLQLQKKNVFKILNQQPEYLSMAFQNCTSWKQNKTKQRTNDHFLSDSQ